MLIPLLLKICEESMKTILINKRNKFYNLTTSKLKYRTAYLRKTLINTFLNTF